MNFLQQKSKVALLHGYHAEIGKNKWGNYTKIFLQNVHMQSLICKVASSNVTFLQMSYRYTQFTKTKNVD